MAEENIVGGKFTIDITNFKAGITEANRLIRLADSEFKSATAGMGAWADSAEGLEAKQKQLNTTIEAQEAKIKALALEHKRAADEYGETSRAAVELEIKLNNEKAALERNKKALSDVAEAAEDMEKGLKDAGDAAGDTEGFTIMKGAIADLVSSGIQMAISAVGNLIGSLMELPEATKEFRSVFNAAMQSAEDSAVGVDGAKKAFEEFYKVAGDEGQAAEATSHLAGLVKSEEELEKALDGVIGAWVEYGDSISIEGLSEAANETSRSGKITGQFADALTWAGKSEEEFQKKLDGLSTEQERQQLIVSTLNELYGENAKKYAENNQSLLDTNAANLKLLESQSLLATSIEPFTAAWTNLKANALDLITPVLTNLAGTLTEMVTWLNENEWALSYLQGVAITAATAFGILAAALGIQSLINGVTKAFALLNTTILANPFVLVTALVAGLVAGIIYLWKTNEDFRNGIKTLWAGIKNDFSVAINAILGFFDWMGEGLGKLVTWFTNLETNAKQAFTNILSSVTAWVTNMSAKAVEVGTNFINKVVTFFSELPNKIWAWLVNTTNKVISWGSDLASGAKNAAGQLVTAVVEKVGELPGKMANAGKDLIEGIWNGINDKVAWLKGKVSGVVDKIKGWFTGSDGFDTHSPSKWSEGVFTNVMQGADVAMSKYKGSKIKDTISAIKTGVEAGVSGGSAAAPVAAAGNTYNFYQTNNSPKSLSRKDLYRQSRNLLGLAGRA